MHSQEWLCHQDPKCGSSVAPTSVATEEGRSQRTELQPVHTGIQSPQRVNSSCGQAARGGTFRRSVRVDATPAKKRRIAVKGIAESRTRIGSMGWRKRSEAWAR